MFASSSSGSVHKIWWVKNGGSNLIAKEGVALDDTSIDLNLSHKSLEDKVLSSQSSLADLEPLCITSLTDGLGQNIFDKEPTVVSLIKPIQNEALRDLGFVSPPKVYLAVSKGYFLRSCSKYVDGGIRSDRDPFGKHLPFKGWDGVLVNTNQSVKDRNGALRAMYASSEHPL